MVKKWISFSIAAMIFATGCSKNNQETVQEQPEIEEVEGIEETDEAEQFAYSYPLTGIGSNEEVEGRAYAVMINNHPKARPQSGLQKADIVYELLAEGDVTRFLAIFQSEQADSIGPVRSARDYYIELAKGYDALYIAHGYSPEAKEMLESGYIDNINGMAYDGTLFKRSSTRKAPHNSYISSENIFKGAEKAGYDMGKSPSSLPFLTEGEIEHLAHEKAHSVSIAYFSSDLFNVIFKYDEELQKYKRFSNGELTVDLDTEEPVLLDNLFIIETDHKIIDNAGRRDIDLISGGDAYLLQKGQKQEVKWKSVDGKIVPYSNGDEVGFVPGKTWINVVPNDGGLEQLVSFNDEETD